MGSTQSTVNNEGRKTQDINSALAKEKEHQFAALNQSKLKPDNNTRCENSISASDPYEALKSYNSYSEFTIETSKGSQKIRIKEEFIYEVKVVGPPKEWHIEFDDLSLPITECKVSSVNTSKFDGRFPVMGDTWIMFNGSKLPTNKPVSTILNDINESWELDTNNGVIHSTNPYILRFAVPKGEFIVAMTSNIEEPLDIELNFKPAFDHPCAVIDGVIDSALLEAVPSLGNKTSNNIYIKTINGKHCSYLHVRSLMEAVTFPMNIRFGSSDAEKSVSLPTDLRTTVEHYEKFGSQCVLKDLSTVAESIHTGVARISVYSMELSENVPIIPTKASLQCHVELPYYDQHITSEYVPLKRKSYFKPHEYLFIVKNKDFASINVLLLMKYRRTTRCIGVAVLPFHVFHSGRHINVIARVKDERQRYVGTVNLNIQFTALISPEKVEKIHNPKNRDNGRLAITDVDCRLRREKQSYIHLGMAMKGSFGDKGYSQWLYWGRSQGVTSAEDNIVAQDIWSKIPYNGFFDKQSMIQWTVGGVAGVVEKSNHSSTSEGVAIEGHNLPMSTTITSTASQDVQIIDYNSKVNSKILLLRHHNEVNKYGASTTVDDVLPATHGIDGYGTYDQLLDTERGSKVVKHMKKEVNQRMEALNKRNTRNLPIPNSSQSNVKTSSIVLKSHAVQLSSYDNVIPDIYPSNAIDINTTSLKAGDSDDLPYANGDTRPSNDRSDTTHTSTSFDVLSDIQGIQNVEAFKKLSIFPMDDINSLESALTDTYRVVSMRCPTGIEVTRASNLHDTIELAVVSGFHQVNNHAALAGAKVGYELYSVNGKKVFEFITYQDTIRYIKKQLTNEVTFEFRSPPPVTTTKNKELRSRLLNQRELSKIHRKVVTVRYDAFEEYGIEWRKNAYDRPCIAKFHRITSSLEQLGDVELGSVVMEVNGRSMLEKSVLQVQEELRIAETPLNLKFARLNGVATAIWDQWKVSSLHLNVALQGSLEGVIRNNSVVAKEVQKTKKSIEVVLSKSRWQIFTLFKELCDDSDLLADKESVKEKLLDSEDSAWALFLKGTTLLNWDEFKEKFSEVFDKYYSKDSPAPTRISWMSLHIFLTALHKKFPQWVGGAHLDTSLESFTWSVQELKVNVSSVAREMFRAHNAVLNETIQRLGIIEDLPHFKLHFSRSWVKTSNSVKRAVYSMSQKGMDCPIVVQTYHPKVKAAVADVDGLYLKIFRHFELLLNAASRAVNVVSEKALRVMRGALQGAHSGVLPSSMVTKDNIDDFFQESPAKAKIVLAQAKKTFEFEKKDFEYNPSEYYKSIEYLWESTYTHLGAIYSHCGGDNDGVTSAITVGHFTTFLNDDFIFENTIDNDKNSAGTKLLKEDIDPQVVYLKKLLESLKTRCKTALKASPALLSTSVGVYNKCNNADVLINDYLITQENNNNDDDNNDDNNDNDDVDTDVVETVNELRTTITDVKEVLFEGLVDLYQMEHKSVETLLLKCDAAATDLKLLGLLPNFNELMKEENLQSIKECESALSKTHELIETAMLNAMFMLQADSCTDVTAKHAMQLHVSKEVETLMNQFVELSRDTLERAMYWKEYCKSNIYSVMEVPVLERVSGLRQLFLNFQSESDLSKQAQVKLQDIESHLHNLKFGVDDDNMIEKLNNFLVLLNATDIWLLKKLEGYLQSLDRLIDNTKRLPHYYSKIPSEVQLQMSSYEWDVSNAWVLLRRAFQNTNKIHQLGSGATSEALAEYKDMLYICLTSIIEVHGNGLHIGSSVLEDVRVAEWNSTALRVNTAITLWKLKRVQSELPLKFATHERAIYPAEVCMVNLQQKMRDYSDIDVKSMDSSIFIRLMTGIWRDIDACEVVGIQSAADVCAHLRSVFHSRTVQRYLKSLRDINNDDISIIINNNNNVDVAAEKEVHALLNTAELALRQTAALKLDHEWKGNTCNGEGISTMSAQQMSAFADYTNKSSIVLSELQSATMAAYKRVNELKEQAMDHSHCSIVSYWKDVAGVASIRSKEASQIAVRTESLVQSTSDASRVKEELSRRQREWQEISEDFRFIELSAKVIRELQLEDDASVSLLETKDSFASLDKIRLSLQQSIDGYYRDIDVNREKRVKTMETRRIQRSRMKFRRVVQKIIKLHRKKRLDEEKRRRRSEPSTQHSSDIDSFNGVAHWDSSDNETEANENDFMDNKLEWYKV